MVNAEQLQKLHIGIEWVKPLNDTIHVVVHVIPGDKLFGVFLASLAQQNRKPLNFIGVRLQHPQHYS